MKADEFVHYIKESPSFRECIEYIQEMPEKKPEYGDIDIKPADPLNRFLEENNLKLYSHQTKALRCMREGKNILLSTPTASGKTLAFNIPVFESLFFNKKGTALYIYPAKALTNDQLNSLKFLENKTGICVFPAVYDGDTSTHKRSGIRENSRIILTNPYEINAVLAWHHKWERFFSSLQVIVIDEVHQYRGIFGSQMAYLIRRLKRVVQYYGKSPIFFLSSATLANPLEFAEQLIGEKFTFIDTDGSPKGARYFILYNPGKSLSRELSVHGETVRLLTESVKNGLHTLCFTQSRQMAEQISLWSNERLFQFKTGKKDEIASYRAGYLPKDRRKLENDLKTEQIKALVSTNALELGIDIGSLDVVILSGYPGTMISTWQQSGRAGRRNTTSCSILVAFPDPLSQYYVNHHEVFFGSPNEEAIIDLTNPFIISGQVLLASAELPVNPVSDAVYFPYDLHEAVESHRKSKLLANTLKGYVYCGRKRPYELIPLGTISGISYLVLCHGKVIETLSLNQAYREAYPGAILLHQGEKYLSNMLDLDNHIVHVERTDVEYFTKPLKDITLDLIKEDCESKWEFGRLVKGEVSVTECYSAFKKIEGDNIIGIEPLSLPILTFTTKSLFFTLNHEIIQIMSENGFDIAGSLHGAEHALIAMMPLLVLCDRRDIGGLSTPFHISTGCPTVFIYDGYEGGIGLTDRAYERFGDLISAAYTVVKECTCTHGCPSCIYSPKCGNENQPLDKRGTIMILSSLARSFKNVSQ